MRGKKSCCYKCKKRTATCHGTCPEYAEELRENEERLLAAKKDRENREAIHTPAFQRRAREFLNNQK